MENEAVKAVFKVLEGHPILTLLASLFLILLFRGPDYINAISSAWSQKRRDDVELADKEAKLQKRIEEKRQKRLGLK
jgi:hypothetical protein